MLARDYIMRLLNDFNENLELLLSRKKKEDDPELEVALQSLYNTYFNHLPKYYYNEDGENILNDLMNKYEGTEILTRIEMLAELLYQDALCKQSEEQKNLLSKSLYLLEYSDKNSGTFSIQRRDRIDEIKKRVSF